MSKAKKKFSIGVVKLDFKKSGFPDVKAVANQWSQDSDFNQIIVRKVSKDNFGIQFIYVTDKEENACIGLIEELKKSHGLYAVDVHNGIIDDYNGWREDFFITS